MSNAELNERDLENVSGGGFHDYQEAEMWCEMCPQRSSCGDHFDDLVHYIDEHGSLGFYNECPYFR